MSADNHASLATLLYNDKAEEGDNDSHGLMEYLQHDYPHTETGADVAAHHGRTDPNIAPLPTHQLGHERTPTPNRSSQPPQASGSNHARFIDIAPATNNQGPNVRSPSPPNPSIPIPTSLARLASRTIASLDLPDPASLSSQENVEASILADFTLRGEMGGKRRKQPHERAGWKEMDEEPRGTKRRRARKSDTAQQSQAQSHKQDGQSQAAIQSIIGAVDGHSTPGATLSNNAEIGQLAELSRMALETSILPSGTGQQHGQSSNPVDDVQIDPSLATGGKVDEQDVASGQSHPQPQGQDQTEGTQGTPEPKSRSEQNKRAQQAFRRRREEHMKKLEMDSAQLQVVKKQSEHKDAILRDAILTIESSKIEIAALQSALRNLVSHSTVSPFTSEGFLNVEDTPGAAGKDDPALDHALELLSRQAREAAKMTYGRK